MILEKVKKTIEEYGLIRKKERILLAVSGGPDSVALLYLLDKLKKEYKINLHVAHLDHGLRKESHLDAQFVKGLTLRLGIPVTITRIEISKLANKGSLEEAAREIRLKFLFNVAKKIKADKIAFGHNLDDQAETVLMRILRGTGLCGLTGIMPKRKISGFQLIRPLIKISRREIEAFLKKRKLKPCRDMSNQQDIYFRNKIRNRLLPLLEKEYNRNIKELLANMAESIGMDYDYLNKRTEKIAAKMQAKINLTEFLKLHPSLQRLLLRFYITKTQGDTRRITFCHIREIEKLVSTRPVNSIVHLPKGVSVTKKKRVLVFLRK